MFDTSSILNNLSFVMVFIEGIVSFFSPCVIPMIPIYIGYLAGKEEDGTFQNSKKKMILFTISFIFGIFAAIFLLHISLSLIQHFLKDYAGWIASVGGIIIVILGIYQLGIFKSASFKRTFKFSLPFKNKMNVIIAFLMGFTFGFAWTPCIGPALSSILLLASSANSIWISNLYIIIYALGFTLPFLAIGFFSEFCLQWIRKHKKIMNYTTKIGAIILIIMGLLMATGKLDILASSSSTINVSPETKQEEKVEAIDFSLVDQHGQTISLSSMKGKVVFLNFWATWCPPCRQELPDIQALYEKYKDNDDVAIITVVLPGGQELSKEGIIDFINDNQYTMPVLFDTGEVYGGFGISSMPTTFMIDKDGIPFGYVQGQVSSAMMEDMIRQTLAHQEEK